MDDVDSRLIQLENAQLVRRMPEEDGSFIFKHALTQEAAYESLLLKKRSEIHRLVAKACEQVYAGQLDEFAAVLAQHYDQAGDKAKALDYSVRAGDAAMRLNAHTEAIAHYSRALALARIMQEESSERGPVSGEQLSHLYLGRGRALELSGQYVEALANYEEMEREGVERKDGELKLSALMERAKLYVVPNPNRNPATGKALTLQALTVARELNDRPAQAKILWNLMLSEVYGGGDLGEAVANGERSLALARELGLREQTAFTTNDLGLAYFHYGDLGRAQQLFEQSHGLWRELGDLPMLTDNLGNTSLLHLYLGNYDDAVRFSDEGYKLSQSMGHAWGEAHTRFLIGWVYLERGEWEKAIEVMQAAIRAAEQAGNPGVQVGTRAELAWALGLLGEVERGLELTQLSQRLATDTFEILRPWVLAVQARLYLLQAKIDEADQAVRDSRKILVAGSLFSPMLQALAEGELALAKREFQQAIRIADDLLLFLEKRKQHLFVADGLYLKAQALWGDNQVEEAGQALEEAHKEAEAVGSRRMLWQILALSREVEKERGNEKEARALQEQAREIVSYIADHAPPEFRDSFLNVPRVRMLRAT